MLAQVTYHRHFIEARLVATRLDFLKPLGLLLGGEFQRLQILEGR